MLAVLPCAVLGLLIAPFHARKLDLLRICRDRAAEGDAVVVVLHDLGLAAAYADRAVVLHGGRVAVAGAPADVFTGELLGEVYRQPVDVFPHPRTGVPLVVPTRTVPGPS